MTLPRTAAVVTTLCIATAICSSSASADGGLASWYGPGLYGHRLACGGHLWSNTWGVAHRWLPCNTRLTVCLRRCVRVTVIDRGPYVYSRVLDLTAPVARSIGLSGVSYVRWWRS